MKRSLLSFILCGAILPAAFSFSPDSELVPTGHWLYGALERIYADAGEASLGVCAPASRFELRSYLDSIDIDSLCEQGRALYRKASEFLGEREPIGDWFCRVRLKASRLPFRAVPRVSRRVFRF